MKPLVIHLLPYDGIGGVEVAARTVASGEQDGFEFRKAFIADKRGDGGVADGLTTGYRSENSVRAMLAIARRIIAARPAVLVLSLWRSCLVGLVVKLVRPRTRLVLFLHNNVDAHRLDAVVTRIVARLARAIWADSDASARARLPGLRRPVRTISFRTERLAALPAIAPTPAFVWWGRLHPRKRVGAAIAFVALMRSALPDVRFLIVGPDGGDEAALHVAVQAAGLGDAVSFHGAADHAAIRKLAVGHSFFLQLSEAEGMSMATVEAMQFGLIPVVTPVGEIASYVVPGRNGIWYDADAPEAALASIVDLLADPERLARMREAAIGCWRDRPLYRDDFLAACRDVLAGAPDELTKPSTE